MGFPEYVDRCRTEVAIRKLLEGAESMSFVAGDSGFGTPQAMRTAFREYTGFLPSEMKSHFDD
jgi:AraC-like DNA-binding protein